MSEFVLLGLASILEMQQFTPEFLMTDYYGYHTVRVVFPAQNETDDRSYAEVAYTYSLKDARSAMEILVRLQNFQKNCGPLHKERYYELLSQANDLFSEIQERFDATYLNLLQKKSARPCNNSFE